MTFSLEAGWIQQARAIPSPNYNERPIGEEISLLVIHNISLPPEQFGSGDIEQFFCNQLDPHRHPYFENIASLKVSSHFLISRKGELVQFVATDQRAWHAGESDFRGRSNCNDFAIGIELEGTDKLPYSQAQYDCLIRLSKTLMDAYPAIEPSHIVGHCHIAPERKTDPGPAFDWSRLLSSIEGAN